jgi:hypothetical protein
LGLRAGLDARETDGRAAGPPPLWSCRETKEAIDENTRCTGAHRSLFLD